MPAATTNLTNGLQHFKNAKEDPNAKVLWNRSEVKNPELNNILKSVNVEENDPGIIYNTKSKISQEIAKSNTMQNFFKENEEAIRSGNMKTGSVEFNYRNGYNRTETDLHAAFQHATIVAPKIQGNKATFWVLDRYDFSHRDGSGSIIEANNYGDRMQKQGVLRPYFIMSQVEMDLYE